ncbi:MAG: AMP-binding protein [Evtepia gabavorous]
MARLAPQQEALVWCNSEGQEAQFTFADISRRSSQAAQVFLQAGIRRGDRVMVALKRHYEYWFVTVALHKIGAVLIPMTHMLTQEDILYQLRCAQSRPSSAPPGPSACAVASAVPRRAARVSCGRFSRISPASLTSPGPWRRPRTPWTGSPPWPPTR